MQDVWSDGGPDLPETRYLCTRPSAAVFSHLELPTHDLVNPSVSQIDFDVQGAKYVSTHQATTTCKSLRAKLTTSNIG
jgi:hypothetical protein